MLLPRWLAAAVCLLGLADGAPLGVPVRSATSSASTVVTTLDVMSVSSQTYTSAPTKSVSRSSLQKPTSTSSSQQPTSTPGTNTTTTANLDLNSPGNPIIILKLDDLYRFEQCIDRFDNVRHLLVNNNIKAGFGVITRTLEGIGYDDKYCKWLRAVDRTGFIEIWNHGIDHVRGEFRGDAEDQIDKINYAQSLLKRCGISATSFGAPFNDNNNDTMAALQKIPEITNIFFPVRDTLIDDSSSVFVYFNYPFPAQRCDMEFSRVGDVNFDYFKRNYERSRYKEPVLVLQGHPAKWDSTLLLEFRRILQYLRSNNATFMKPTEYLQYAIAQAQARKDAPSVVSTSYTYTTTVVGEQGEGPRVVTATTTVDATIAPSMPPRFLRDTTATAIPTSTYTPESTATRASPTGADATQAPSTFQIVPVPPQLQ